MAKEKLNVNVTVDEEGEVKVTLTDEQKSRIPRPGESIYVVEPYPVDDEDEETIGLDDVRERPIMAYSFDSLMAKAVVLSDDLDSVKVNGDFVIYLNKRVTESTKKQMIFSNEEDAKNKYLTLMNISVKENDRRLKKAEDIKQYLETALEKMHH